MVDDEGEKRFMKTVVLERDRVKEEGVEVGGVSGREREW
jgi:hypothetical protein